VLKQAIKNILKMCISSLTKQKFRLVSRKLATYIRKLHNKKNLINEKVFVVEGSKSVLLVLSSEYKIKFLIATPKFLNTNASYLSVKNFEIMCTDENMVNGLSKLKTNTTAIAVVYRKENLEPQVSENSYILALDKINDPSNLGSIVRIADWYGIKDIVCSKDTVDIYNTKAIQASMGSFINVNCYYTDLLPFINKIRDYIPVIGSLLVGESIYNADVSDRGVIVVGNESKGISREILELLTKKVTIPRLGNANSLNVAMATAIICDNLIGRYKIS
jgi:TrmH family RNA methyltransferase